MNSSSSATYVHLAVEYSYVKSQLVSVLTNLETISFETFVAYDWYCPH